MTTIPARQRPSDAGSADTAVRATTARRVGPGKAQTSGLVRGAVPDPGGRIRRGVRGAVRARILTVAAAILTLADLDLHVNAVKAVLGRERT